MYGGVFSDLRMRSIQRLGVISGNPAPCSYDVRISFLTIEW
eukprot:Gb_01981 [translate_table: standard]